MADEQVQIKLKASFLASRKLRFLHLKSQGELLFKNDLCGKYLPLFLGADVLSKCSISVPNLPRTHAKFAKKGLATKVNFPSFVRINGIQGTARGVWFYSIQGLFRVAFEMYSREEQLDMLKCLQGVWTLRFGDKLLDEVMNPLLFDICEGNEEEMDSGKEKLCEPDIPISVSSPSCDEFSMSCDQSKTIGNTANTCPLIMNTTIAEENLEANLKTVKDVQLPHNCKEILQELTDLTRASNNSDDSYSEFYTIVTILRTLLQGYKTTSLSPELSQLDHQQRLLYVMCHWVGGEFKKCKEEISQKVTEFKKRHIATIDSLPPAERVIEELFPLSMIVLLRTWMKDETPKTATESQSVLPYPLIQLILEFANQTLVSGVAHVLYSRLIRVDSV
jgi:hypothetical protein